MNEAYEPTQQEQEELNKLKDKFEDRKFQSSEENPEHTFTITEIGINRYGHMPGEKGDIYSTIEYNDGYVCHPPLDSLKRQMENYSEVEE